MTNRVAVDKPITVRSVNGPEVTIIMGAKATGPGGTGPNSVRCAYLTNGAALYGFTLTNGATHSGGDLSREMCGGGIWCASVAAVVSNCIVTSNTAAYYGGGVYSGTLNACTIWRNSALSGGGACYGALYSCTLTSNSVSDYGGGAFSNLLVNCTLKGNSARNYGGGAYLGTLDNCLLLTNSVSDSYHGNGGGACSNILNGCTLRGNSAAHDGGGVYGGRVTNCIFSANSATYGGGASWSVLNGCLVDGNFAPSGCGGGAIECTLVNCTVTANTGGGCRYSSLTNCIVYFNSTGRTGTMLPSATPAPHRSRAVLATSPLRRSSWILPTEIYGCNPTRLASTPGTTPACPQQPTWTATRASSVARWIWGPMSSSRPPCSTPTPGCSSFGLPTDGSADYADSDGDGMNNWQEWRCLTDPTNALSALRLLTPSFDGTNVTVSWQSVAGVSYFLECSTNLASTPSVTPLATNLSGQPGTTSCTDTNAAAALQRFYRVGVAE